jgi:hypothetical protein
MRMIFPIRGASWQALVARRLDSLARQKAVDGLPVNAENATDANGVQAAVVDEPADRLRVDAELTRDLADAVESVGLGVDGRHEPP